MTDSEAFFVAEAVRHARTLQYPEMMKFLRGMNFAIDAKPDYDAFHKVYQTLNRCDEQLELIASGQMKLPLHPAKKGSRK